MKIITYKPGTKVITQEKSSPKRIWYPKYLNRIAVVIGAGVFKPDTISIRIEGKDGLTFDAYPEEIRLATPRKIKRVISWQ